MFGVIKGTSRDRASEREREREREEFGAQAFRVRAYRLYVQWKPECYTSPALCRCLAAKAPPCEKGHLKPEIRSPKMPYPKPQVLEP